MANGRVLIFVSFNWIGLDWICSLGSVLYLLLVEFGVSLRLSLSENQKMRVRKERQPRLHIIHDIK